MKALSNICRVRQVAAVMKVNNLMLLVVVVHSLAAVASSSGASSCIAREREALLDLKSIARGGLQGVQWNTSNENCCEWAGIECDEATGHVNQISLTLLGGTDKYGDLQDCGALPPSIANITSLQTLNLGGSCFSLFPSPFPALPFLAHLDFSSTFLTSLPPNLGSSVPRLAYLNLAGCPSLFDTIPPQWGNLSHLQYLELGGSVITWNLTHCNWSSLTHLGVSSNIFPIALVLPPCLKQIIPTLRYLDMSFPGQFSTSDALQSLLIQATNLTQLFLSGTDLNSSSTTSILTGSPIPPWLHLIGPQLQTFHVSQCRIQGDVHPTWFRDNMLQLKDFDASNNLLTGPLASLLSPNMSALEHLDLSLNHLSSVGDLSAFPANVLYISLSQNVINGEIPAAYFFNTSTHLQYMDLSHNFFSGPLPFASSSIWSSLTYLDLSNNGFSGSIPDAVGNMSLLSQLTLSNNYLSGCVPESIGNLLSLSSLYTLGDSTQQGLFLGSNSLNCSIPASLGRLVNLLFLDLSKNNLEGQLPISLGNLTSLDLFDLSSNKLGGRIPNAFCNVSTKSAAYEVSLSSNQFVGTIPTSLVGQISASSVMLDISNNLNLFGSLPLNVWSGLVTGTSNFDSFYLDYSHNQISGSLPASIIYNQTISMFVDASYNKLSGSLPSNIAQNCLYYGFEWYASNNFLSGQLSDTFINNITCSWIETVYTKYATISLQNNLLSGTLPESLGSLSGLRYLSLSGNNFSGSIPASLANAKSLQYFDASYNNLEGKIPNFGDGTPYLWAIILRDNKLDGIIPPSITNLTNLAVLDVSRNRLSGIIPFTEFIESNKVSLPQQNEAIADQSRWSAWRLKQIIANHGNVDVIGSLTDLSLSSSSPQDDLSIGFFSFNVSHNMINGSIPTGLANISTLEWLDLSNNQLSGIIPTELLQLTSLNNLNLSYNAHLEGPIPQGGQFSTFTNDSFYGNPDLCGPPLSKRCYSSAPVDPPSTKDPRQVNQGTDSSLLSRIQEEVSLEAVGIGYAIGFVVVGYLITSCLRSRRLLS